MLLTETEAAASLKLCERTLRKERQAGRLAFVKIGRCIRYTNEDLAHFIESRRVVEAGPIARTRARPPSVPVIDFAARREERRSRLQNSRGQSSRKRPPG
jgi:excisionase family DNA binding protein